MGGPSGESGVERHEAPLVELVELFARLRRECAWKAAQTHRTLARHLVEETYEVVEAIESATGPDHLREELGDVLLQVYLHAAIAAEAGEFTIDDVARTLRTKMIHRNPHVFGGESETDAARVNELWEQRKAAEKQRDHVLDGIPLDLPALHRAAKVADRLARDGRPLAATPASDDLGDRLLALAVEAHASGLDPEQALRDALRTAVDRSGAD